MAEQLPADIAPPTPISSFWLLWWPRQWGLEGGSGTARGPAGLFKVLLGRRAMRLRPGATPSDRETEELRTRLFLRAEVPGKEDVGLGPFMVNRGMGPLGMKG